MRYQFAVPLVSTLVGGLLAANVYAQLPPYQPSQRISGEIRVSGSPNDRELIEALEAGFSLYHPELKFLNRLHGPESTLAGVYTDVSDLAFMARELREPMERMAFQWAKLTKPFQIEIANAGFQPEMPAAQFGIFVHADNPLNAVSLAALDGIFGAEHKRSQGNLRTWGDLGLEGEWRSRPIRVLGPESDSILALFFRRLVMHDSRKWNPAYEEFQSDGATLAALQGAPAAIAFATIPAEYQAIKLLAVSEETLGSAVRPNRATVTDRSYPLTRVVTIAVYREPEGRLEPRLEEFIRFILSGEGQAIVDENSGYLALNPNTAHAQLERLQ